VPVVLIHVSAAVTSVVLPRQETGTTTTSTKEAPNPILPVPKEMAWGLGSFLVVVVLMRLWLFPKLKRGMDARYAKVRSDLDGAEAAREAVVADQAQYQAAIAEARAEAARVLEAARHDVDADRATKVTAANASIGEQRAEAAAEIEAARQAALAQVEDIVVEVAASGAERILGVPVERDAARPAVAEVVRAGAAA
jgi:F-type H+-transporting ATPase subunit b